MKKFVCSVCGYVHVGDAAPAECPLCHVGPEKFVEQKEGEMEWACEHVIGVAQGAPEDIMMDLRANFEGECTEVGMYLAMSRVAHREGYPEIGLYWEKAGLEEAVYNDFLPCLQYPQSFPKCYPGDYWRKSASGFLRCDLCCAGGLPGFRFGEAFGPQ